MFVGLLLTAAGCVVHHHDDDPGPPGPTTLHDHHWIYHQSEDVYYCRTHDRYYAETDEGWAEQGDLELDIDSGVELELRDHGPCQYRARDWEPGRGPRHAPPGHLGQ